MAQQRRHNRRRKARGRFRGLYRFLAIALILSAITAACVVFFRVQTIRVEGGNRYSEGEIIQAAGVEPGNYLALLDIGRITRQIRAQLPYVERASIRRILPDTVIITVEESAAAAALRCQGQWWLVNSGGKLLESISAAQADSYPALTGIELITLEAGTKAIAAEADENRWSCALELLTALEERGELAKLKGLDCSAAGVFTARYGERYTLLLPTTINYERVSAEQFSYFFSLLDEAMPELEEGEQDLVDFTAWESTGRIYARSSD